MKTPAKPPVWQEVFQEFMDATDSQSLIAALSAPVDDSAYLPWEKLRFKTPPANLNHNSWWTLIKMSRTQKKRSVALAAKSSEQFSFVLTDDLLRMCMEITERTSGRISLPEQIATGGERDRYVVNSLIEEAITSSQLEGAATSRRVAKHMIRSGRAPLNRSERMILNNYYAMRRIQEIRDEALTPELVTEIHRIVTAGTLDDPLDAGRIQTEDKERVSVWGDEDQLLHTPPPVSELPARLKALCAFANDKDSKTNYLPAPLRAIILHFMMGYDHYFADGNGRTARAVFYWSMLNQGYWLTEYITISRILKQAPSRYAGSFLLTEDDDGDLTYFLLYHAKVVIRALNDLEVYLQEKAQEIRQVKKALTAIPGEFNHRQLAVLELAMREPSTAFTAQSHSMSHNVSGETARKDLADLESRGLLRRSRNNKKYYWTAVADVAERLRIAAEAGLGVTRA